MKNHFFCLVLVLLLICLFVSLFSASDAISAARSSTGNGTIYIRADGSIDPSTAPISTVDNITYILTGNITSDADGIVIERDNIVIDGAGYTVHPTGTGVVLSGRRNVTIKDTNIETSGGGLYLNSTADSVISGNNITNNDFGIWLDYSSNNSMSGNNIMNNDFAINLLSSSDNSISANNMTENRGDNVVYVSDSYNNTVEQNTIMNNLAVWAINLFGSSSTNVVRNVLTNDTRGILLYDSGHNVISGNTITECPGSWGATCITGESSDNKVYGNTLENNTKGIVLEASNNIIFHNNFLDNQEQVETNWPVNTWDGGYTSCGNYWSDYNGTDFYSGPHQDEPGSDDIGDTPYIIDENNQDRYPLMEQWPPKHELVTSITAPSFLKSGSLSSLNATTANEGLNGEINVEFSLLINDTTVNSTTVVLLQPGNSCTLRYFWTPTVEGTYNITAYAHPVPGETFIGDNRVAEFVTVSATIVVPDSYPTIQAAIVGANSGDTIFVKEGTYYEHIVMDKSITLVGEDRDRTIIDGSSNGTAMNITANHANVTGFTIQKSGVWPYCGIHVSSFNNISYNIIRNCPFCSVIELINSSNTLISGNFITANEMDAVYLFNSSGNVISENNITDNGRGITLSGDDQFSSSDNVVFGNSVTNSKDMDISLYRSPSNIISQNNIANSPIGIHIIDDPSINITIRENNITNNTIGILFSSNSRLDNTIYHNNFVNNTQQVNTPYSMSVWDDGYPSGGNYWSDYSGADANHDGIGDTPYQIDSFYNNTDNYPLMAQYIIPEFPIFFILPIFFIATLLAVIIYRRKTKTSDVV